MIFREQICPQPIKLKGLFRHALTGPDQVDIRNRVPSRAYWNDQKNQFALQRLPLVYDPEIIKDDEGRANNITREQVALNTQAFKDAVENTSAYQVDIYSNLPWEHELFDGTTLNNYDIWYADYENPPQTPYHFMWWQYSMTGTVPGIEGNVDLDLWMVKAE